MNQLTGDNPHGFPEPEPETQSETAPLLALTEKEHARSQPEVSISKSSSDDVPFTKEQKKLLVLLCTQNFLVGCLIAVMIPFFPLEAAERGLSQATISSVFSCYALTHMLINPLIGRISPVVGVTRLYNIGIATAGLSTITFGALYHLPTAESFIVACFLVRIVEAAGAAAVANCSYTIIGNRFPAKTSTAVAILGMMLSLGLATSPAIGGGLYALAGFGAPFYTLGALMMLTAAVNFWLIPPLTRYDRNDVPFFTMLSRFVASFECCVCLCIVFLFALIFPTLDASISPYAFSALGITPESLGFYFLVASLSQLPTSFFVARLSERLTNPYPLISFAIALTGVAIIIMPPSPLLGLEPAWWLLGLGLILLEIFLNISYIPCFQFMLRACIRQGLADDVITQAFVSSVFFTGMSLGSVLGPVSGGFLVDLYGFPWMMTGLAALVLLVLVLVSIQAVLKCSAIRRQTGHEVD